MLYWLGLSNVKSGPIVTRVNNNGLSIPKATCFTKGPRGVMHYVDANNEEVGITEKMMERVLKQAFNDSGYHDAQLYTIRKTATMWGARCGARQYALMATGRWREHSTHFHTYVQSGC